MSRKQVIDGLPLLRGMLPEAEFGRRPGKSSPPCSSEPVVPIVWGASGQSHPA
jgi:hypothetical protein